MNERKALLLTDVTDSTRLAEAMGEAATAGIWSRHDRLARDLLPSFRGREIDKTDGMLLLFDEAADAVGYALAYQQALRSLEPPLKARVGLHVGPVALRENSAADIARGAKPLEVDGAAKAIAARVLAIAMGGQILLSDAARRDLPDDRLRCRSHGHWRLKGVAEPVELFEVGDDAAPFTPPPDADKAYRVARQGDLWLPVREIRQSLPAERDAFVGRSQALDELWRRMQSSARLVTVVGIGGSGKTRLATQFGRTWLGEYPGGVWFCDLAGARDVEGIVRAVAKSLDVPLGKDDPVDQLGHAITGHGSCLMILDNFEHVACHAPATLGYWLDRAGQARFVVTSREVLGLPGEEVLPLPPLAPADAASLFVRRAQSSLRGSDLDAQDQAAIAQLVQLLDGLPLAIELAAARVRVLPPRALLARMNERFRLLASSAGRHGRQSTLRAAFDWSWDLLSPIDRAALAQLSVFDGGFTLEAAEAVLDFSCCSDGGWPIDAVQSLVDKSFVYSLSANRFGLLVSVQEYAAEHLRTEGRYLGSGADALREAQLRHGRWFASLAAQRRSTEDRCADLGNLLAACRRAVSRGDTDTAADALDGAWDAIYQRGPFEAGAKLAESVCAMPGLGDRAAAHAQLVLAQAMKACGRAAESPALLERALVHARSAGDARCEAKAIDELGIARQIEGRTAEARSRHVEAIRLARGLGIRDLECAAVKSLANVDLVEGRLDSAISNYEVSLAIARECGDRRMQAELLGNLSTANGDAGRWEPALAQSEQALVAAREIGHRVLEGRLYCNLGLARLLRGEYRESIDMSDVALEIARELGHTVMESVVRCNLGIALERMESADEARVQYESAVAIAHAIGERRYEGQFLGYLGGLHARQGRPDEARRCLDAGEALLRDVADLLGLGVLLCGRAEADHLVGKRDAALVALGAARAVAAETGAGAASEMGQALRRAERLVGC